MKEPKRLLHSEAGLARDILQTASRQAAPEAALEKALLLVDLAVAEKVSRSREPARHVSPPAPSRPLGSGAVRGESSKRHARLPGWLRVGLAFEMSSLTAVGAAMAAGIGGTVIVTELIQRAKSSEIEQSETAPLAAVPKAIIPSAAAPHPSIEAAARLTEEAEPPFVEHGSSVPESSAFENASGPVAPAAPARAAAIEDDWLGEQFGLLGKARRELEAGNQDLALRALDEYERRFPEGTLGHQAAALRARARKAKASATKANETPSGSIVNFGI